MIGYGHGFDVRGNSGERLEHARRVLRGEAGEDQVQRLPIVEGMLGPGGDLPRGRRIVPAVEPHLTAADERPGSEMLQPRRPIRPAHRCFQGSFGHVQGILVAQDGDRERRIHRLVPAGQAGQGQVERAFLVAVAELVLAGDRVPSAAARQPEGAGLMGDLADAPGDFGRIELRDQRHSPLGDRGLFRRNVGQPVAEELLMIER